MVNEEASAATVVECWSNVSELNTRERRIMPAMTSKRPTRIIGFNASSDGAEKRDALGGYGLQEKLHCIACNHLFYDLGAREAKEITCPYCHKSWFESPQDAE
jgi:hypothetical protein